MGVVEAVPNTLAEGIHSQDKRRMDSDHTAVVHWDLAWEDNPHYSSLLVLNWEEGHEVQQHSNRMTFQLWGLQS
jgi:hypothetical protein